VSGEAGGGEGLGPHVGVKNPTVKLFAGYARKTKRWNVAPKINFSFVPFNYRRVGDVVWPVVFLDKTSLHIIHRSYYFRPDPTRKLHIILHIFYGSLKL